MGKGRPERDGLLGWRPQKPAGAHGLGLRLAPWEVEGSVMYGLPGPGQGFRGGHEYRTERGVFQHTRTRALTKHYCQHPDGECQHPVEEWKQEGEEDSVRDD